VRCEQCGIKVEHFPWSAGKRRFTTAFAHFLAAWARFLPWKHVAQLSDCSWGTVASAVDNMVEYGLAHQDLSDLTHIGIDEISREKGQVYLSNVYDLQTCKPIWSGEKWTKATLISFFASLGSERIKKLEGICCDMWDPYIQVIRENAPNAMYLPIPCRSSQ
jgi:transposase